MNKKTLSTIALAIVLIITVIGCQKENTFIPNAYPWTGYFVNVGKADCAILEVDGLYYMIDTGTKSSFPELLSVLKTLDIASLEAIFLSHTHKDHTGGLEPLLQSIPVKMLYSSELMAENKKGGNVVTDLAEEYSVPLVRLKKDEKVPLGNLHFKVLAPSILDEEEDNNNSLILFLEGETYSVLFMGDAEFAEEKTFQAPKSDVLKVAHHGKDDASSFDFIKSVSPYIAIISTDSNEDIKSPGTNTMGNLKHVGAKILQTQHENLAIKILSDENGLKNSSLTGKDIPQSVNIKIENIISKEEKITINNPTEKDVDISGWFIASSKDNYFFFPENTTILKGESLSVVSGKTPLDGDYLWKAEKMWKNKGDGVLYDQYGKIIDSFNIQD